jgi:hypothetical protein
MAAAYFDTPAVIFGMPDRLFDLLLRMPGSPHPWIPRKIGENFSVVN